MPHGPRPRLPSKFSYVNSYEATRKLQGLLINGTPDNPGPAAPSAQSAITNLATLLPETDPSNFAKKNERAGDSLPRGRQILPGTVDASFAQHKPLSTWAKRLYDGQVDAIKAGSPRLAKLQPVLADKSASRWLLLPPNLATGHLLPRQESRAVLKYRLGIPLFFEPKCIKCRRDQDQWGDHALNCSKRPGFKQRHELLVHSLGRLLSLGNIRHSVNDQNVELLGAQGAILRPADLLLPSWNGARSLCVDVTVVSPWTPDGEGNSAGALEQAAARKVAKYRDACQRTGMDFIPLAVTHFGTLGEEASQFLGRVMRSVCEAQLMGDFRVSNCLDWLTFSIQKGIAKQLVARLVCSGSD